MRINFKSLLLIALFHFVNSAFSQAPIRDRWDTLYANVNYNFPIDTAYYQQNNNFSIGNDLILFGDSNTIDPNYYSSFIHRFNPTNNTYTKLNYTRFSTDRGMSCAAATPSGTNTPAFVFFGAKAPFWEGLDSIMVLYKLNTTNNTITTETIQSGPGDYRSGIYNMTFFSPSTNHDSLIIFNHRGYNGDSVDIFKKHVNQTGFVNSNITLPVSITEIKKIFNFNNVLYISGATNSYPKHLINTTNGTTYSVNAGFAASSFSDMVVMDMDTLGGYLYLGLDAGDGYYAMAKTPDGINYTMVQAPAIVRFSDFQNYKNKLFYVKENVGQNPNRPDVRYILPNGNDILSIDTIGRKHNDVYTFKLMKTNNHLLLSGNYLDWGNYNYGTFIYKFVPPVANFSISSNNFCLNAPYTFTSNSIADSVRWFVNTNYNASSSNTFNATFTTAGSNTLGLIAIIGTQKDTLKYTINVYSVSVSTSGSNLGCINNTLAIVPNTTGAMAPISYTWSTSPTLTNVTLPNGTLKTKAGAVGNYTYMVTIKDVNNCMATSSMGSFSVNTNKLISGVTSLSANAVAGNVILYRYEPILTKFDSVTFVAADAVGGFTFANQDANTYIISCEPTSNTLQITYAPNEISWKTATVITHGCANNTNQNISVIPIANIGTGPGLLAGKITEGVGYVPRAGLTAPGNPIGGLNIKGGKNPGGNIVAQSRTNSSGEYTLSSLPLTGPGEYYFILVDIPGLDTNSTYYRSITTGSVSYTDLNFVVDSALINPTNSVGIKEYKVSNGSFKVYPNPTNGSIKIECTLDRSENVSVSLYDITGKHIQTLKAPQVFNNNEIMIEADLKDIKKGVYLLKTYIGTEERTIKLIVTN